jgi:Post-segregation antitoxin CcdA
MPNEDNKSEKLRLNTTVDREVVERVKDMGINISATLEEYLRVLTYASGPDSKDVVMTYDKFLRKIQPKLSQYDISVEIGNDNSFRITK